MNPPIPELAPIGVPGPIWLLKALLYLSFLCHVVFMNLIAGGSLLSAVYGFKGRPKHLWVAGALARMLPFATPFAILFGVAAMLFVQALYGPLFYTAAILVGGPFMVSVAVLLVAYALMYFAARFWERLGGLRKWMSLAVFFLLGFVGFSFGNLFALMSEPEAFLAKYLASRAGWQFHMADPTVMPRFLHVVFGAIAVAGLWVAFGGMKRLRLEPEEGRWQFRSGATWFSGATIVNMVIGLWWLLALPRDISVLFVGKSWPATTGLVLGFGCGVAAMALVLVAINSVRPQRMVMGSIHSLLLALLCMVLMRGVLRDATLEPFYSLRRVTVASQWGAIAIFLALLLGAGWLCWWLVRQLLRPRKPKPGEPVEVLRGPGLTDSGIRRIPPDHGVIAFPTGEPGTGKAPLTHSSPRRLDE